MERASCFFMLHVLLILASSSSSSSAAQAAGPLRVLVPIKIGFTQFVSWSGSPPNTSFDGFSVQVFRGAVQGLPIAYNFVPFGDGISDPSYNEMVEMVRNGSADAIVADLTITRDRLEKVDFTQPYIQSSLVMVVPFQYGSAGTLWDFLKPFSWELWLSIAMAFGATGFVIFILEHKNPEFSRSHRKRDSQIVPEPLQVQLLAVANGRLEREVSSQPYSAISHWRRLMNAYWFTSQAIFFAQQEAVSTHVGRLVTVAWLFVVLIFNSSYTASLASSLSAQLPYPTISGFQSLLKSNVAVGCQEGSFVEGYLETKLGMRAKRLKPLTTVEEYAEELRLGSKKGGVGAILDESPYTQILLKKECDFTTVDDQIAYFGGFAFAFAKNSSLTDDISKGILSLAENGVLQKLKDGWLGGSETCSSTNAASHLRLRSFGGLFLIIGSVYVVCVLWHLTTKWWDRGRNNDIGQKAPGIQMNGVGADAVVQQDAEPEQISVSEMQPPIDQDPEPQVHTASEMQQAIVQAEMDATN